jgi:chemotaxis protein MotA
VQPLSVNLEAMGEADGKFLHCIKVSVLAFANGSAPIVAVEFGRRVIFSFDRPTALELEQVCKAAGQ